MSSGRIIYLLRSRSWDGSARYVLDLALHMRERGWNVTAYTPDARAVDDYFLREGVALRHVPLDSLCDPYTLAVLSRDFRREPKGAILHVNSIHDAFIAMVARKMARRKDMRVIVTMHDSGAWRDNRIIRRIYRNLDAVIFTSRYAFTMFSEWWSRSALPCSREIIRIMHYAMHRNQGDIIPEPAKGSKTALWHGRIAPGKGLETLIDAMILLKGKRIRLQIAGTGHPDYVDAIRRRAAMGGVLHLIDWKGKFGDVEELVSGAHFGVCPAVGDEEFGYPNIEYMAAGRAQITTRHPIQEEYLTDGKDAVFVPPGDPDALASAMLTLAENQDLRLKIGLSAARRARADLSWQRFADSMESIYSSVLGKAGGK